MHYGMQRKDEFEINPQHLPVSVAMTQFHIIFMYEHNVTVLSNTSKKVVFSENFDATKIKQGHFDLFG